MGWGNLLDYKCSSLFTQPRAVKGLLFTTAIQKDKLNPDVLWHNISNDKENRERLNLYSQERYFLWGLHSAFTALSNIWIIERELTSGVISLE